MKLSSKRLLVVFSVCLNVGCVIALSVMLFSGRPTHDQRRQEMISRALASTGLSPEEKSEVRSRIEDFFDQIKGLSRQVRRAKLEQLRLLAASGEVDEPGVNSLGERITALQTQRASIATRDMLSLRRHLGEKDGKAFFGRLVWQVEELDRSR